MKKLTKKELESLRVEVDALRTEIEQELGDEDLNYLEMIQRISRFLEITGRLLIHVSLDPVTWSVGVTNLALHFIIENAELGHNVLHAQYNFLKDDRFNAQTYTWNFSVAESQWRREHNTLHHVFTNVAGKDPDLSYSTFRYHDKMKWNPVYFFQPFATAFSFLTFDYAIGLYACGALDLKRSKKNRQVLGDRTPYEIVRELYTFASKAYRELLKNYVLFPALGGLFAPKIALGNYLASTMRNIFLASVIYTGHFTERSTIFSEEEAQDGSKGARYLRQILASGNFDGGWILSTLSGHLNHQIEHHLFPTLPAWRYPKMAKKVKEICKKYDIPYNTGSFASQFKGVIKRVFTYSMPPKKKKKRASLTTKVIPLRNIA